MFPANSGGGGGGGGNLGSARGRIIIDITSVEAAVAATKRAAQEMGANLARINKAAQENVTVDAERTERAAKAQITAAKAAADIRSKSAAEAAKNVVDAVKREAQASAEAAKVVQKNLFEQTEATNSAVKAEEVLAKAREASARAAQVSTAIIRAETQAIQRQSGEIGRAIVLYSQLATARTQAMAAQGGSALGFPRARPRQLGGPDWIEGEFEEVTFLPNQRRALLSENLTAMRSEVQARGLVVVSAREQARAQADAATSARAQASAYNAARMRSLDNLTGLQEIPFHRRMPTFAQFQLYPLMQLFQVIGATDASNVTALSMGVLGLADTVRTFIPTITELGRGFGQAGLIFDDLGNVIGENHSIIGRYTRAVVGLIPGLSGTAAAFVAVGAVLAPVAVAALAVAAAIKAFSDAAERGREAALATTDALRKETEQRQSLVQRIGSSDGFDPSVLIAEMQAQGSIATLGQQSARAYLSDLQSQRESHPGMRSPLLTGPSGNVFEAQELDAAIEVAEEAVEKATDDIKAIGQELQILSSEGARAAAVLERVNQPLREAAQRREFSDMSAGDLSEQMALNTENLILLRQKDIDLTNEYDAALASGQFTLAAILSIQLALNQARVKELEESQRIAQQVLPLTRARERLRAVVEGVRGGALQFASYLDELVDSQSAAAREAAMNRSMELAALARSGDPGQIREMIAVRQDEANAIRAQLPDLMANALHSASAREQLVEFIRRLGIIGEDVKAFSDELPVAETRQKLNALVSMLRETLPNLFPQSGIDQLRGQIEGAKRIFTNWVDGIIADVEARVSREQEFAGLLRTATPESLGERIQALQDERVALDAGIASLRLTALVSDEARAKMDAMIERRRQVGLDISRLIEETLPAAARRAQNAMLSDIHRIERERDAAIQSVRDDLARREAELERDRQEAISEAHDDAAEAREDAVAKRAKALNKVEDDLARQREKILRRFAIDSRNAIANRDALAFHMAKQRRDEDLANLKQEGEERKKELDAQYKEQNEAIDKRLAKQLASIKKRYDDQLRTAREAANRQIQMERDRATAEIAARRAAYQAQYYDLRNALMAEYTLRAQAYDSIVNGARWARDQVNAIMRSMTGTQVVVPNVIYSSNPFANHPTAPVGTTLPSYYVPSTTAGSAGGGGGRNMTLTPYASGASFLPNTGPILAHMGEGVVNAETNAIIRRMLGSNYSQPQLAAAVMRGATGGSTAQGINIPITVNGTGKTARQIVRLVDERLLQTLIEAGVP